MADVEVIQVIHTRLLRLGKGHDASDPIRIIDQYWDMEGNLMWEIDPFKERKRRRGCVD